MHKCNDNCHPECCPKKLCLKQVYQPTCLTNLTIADYETPIVVIDTPTIDFTASSVNNHTITADVKVSEVSGNAIEVKPDGLYSPLFVETPETPLVATDTTTINFTTSGTAGHALTGAVNISSTAGNILTSNGTGLYVPTPTVETTLVATDTSTIDFTTSGTAGHALTASVKLSATAGNTITANADGLYSPLFVETPETPLVATDTTTINFTTSGTAGHALTGAVNISSTAGNILTSNGTGLYVPNQIALGLVEYADNAAAVTAGLTVGSLYRTGDVLKIVHA